MTSISRSARSICNLALCSILAFCWFATQSNGAERPSPEPINSLDMPTTRWHMLNVSPGNEQADCHLIIFPDGRKILIDVADAGDAPGTALAAIQALKVTDLDLVLISHFHLDHYGRLLDLVNAGVTVKRVAINVPDEVSALPERPWGCDLEHVKSTLDALRSKGIAVFTPNAGETLMEYAIDGLTLAKLEVVCLYRGLDSPIGPTDVNDTSIIVRLSHGRNRALFTGDLNGPLGSWLAKSDFDLRADILKAPHHGTEACAPNEFFDRVQASAVLVPAPTSLWLSARSMRIRNHFAEKSIPTFVNGIHGNVLVTFRQDSYSIETER
jgi:beta-lactamase superfamily II metal-dependent hydrolase